MLTKQQLTSTLEHYLTSVNKVEQTQSRQTKRQVKRKEELKAEPQVAKQAQVNEQALSHTVSYNDIDAYIKSQSEAITTLYKGLTSNQLSIFKQLITVSNGMPLPYTELISKLAQQLNMGQYKLKKILAIFHSKQMIIVINHAWKGHLITASPLWLDYVLKDEDISDINPDISSSRLISKHYMLPFEKQLMLMLHSLTQMLPLNLNQANKLNKQTVIELRDKILAINPMLSIIDDEMLQVMPPFESKYRTFYFICDDALVSFLLELAFQLQFIDKQRNKLYWNEQRFKQWLEIDDAVKPIVLKQLLMEIIAEYTDAQYSFLIKHCLAASEQWKLLSHIMHANEIKSIELAYAFGWHDVLSHENSYFIKQKSFVYNKTKPYLLSNGQILCLQDCDAQSFWNIIQIARFEKLQEVMLFQLNVNAIACVLHHGKNEIEQLEKELQLTSCSQLYEHWKRLCLLAAQINDKDTKKSPSRTIKNDSKEKGKRIENRLANFSFLHCMEMLHDDDKQYIQADIELVYKNTLDYPEIWFTKLKAYHRSIVKEMIKLAVINGLEVELTISSGTVMVKINEITEQIETEQTYINMIRVSNEMTDSVILQHKLNINEINAIRLIRDY